LVHLLRNKREKKKLPCAGRGESRGDRCARF